MDSKTKLAWLGAVVVSAAALYRSSGLDPVWWLVWLAPLPVLLLAPRVSALAAFSAAALAWTLGGLNTWTYYWQLKLPLAVMVMALLISAAVFGLAALLLRFFARRNRPLLAAVSVPCVWVAYQYLFAIVNGTYANLAYTQMDCLPVIQLAALGGIWPICFAVMLFSPAIVHWRKLIAPAAALYAIVFGFGFWRLHQPDTSDPETSDPVTVGMVASDLPANRRPENAEALRLLREYALEVDLLAKRGARIVMLPEMTALIAGDRIAAVDELFSAAARAARIDILVPVLHTTNGRRYNESRLYSPPGRLLATYRKHHLVPGLEDGTIPATGLVTLYYQSAKVGLEICRDMDYPELSRRYGQQAAGLMLVPAWDFDTDAWLHGRMAIMRGVENGFNIARVAKQGRLSVTDTRGRVLAEQLSNAAPFSTLVAPIGTVHVSTLYTRWGDWFAYLNLALLTVLVAELRKRKTAQ